MMKKSIGIGFVGGGFITRFHIQSLIGVRNCEVLGVMSRTKSSAEDSAALARTIGVGEAKAFETVSDMIAHPDIDAHPTDLGGRINTNRLKPQSGDQVTDDVDREQCTAA